MNHVREHVRAGHFVVDATGTGGTVIRLDEHASHVQARVRWTTGAESWVDLNTLRRVSALVTWRMKAKGDKAHAFTLGSDTSMCARVKQSPTMITPLLRPGSDHELVKNYRCGECLHATSELA